MRSKCIAALASLLAVTLSACGGGEVTNFADYDVDDDAELPSRYGLYVDQEGQLGRLDGDRTFQIETWGGRSGLQSDVTFVVYDRALADPSQRLADMIRLHRVAHVRNDVDASGQARPVDKDIWVVAELPDHAVALDFQPVRGVPEMVRVIPARPLTPGLYALQLHHSEAAISGRFGIEWPKVDKTGYIAENCVDRLAESPPAYKPCSDRSAQVSQQQITQQPPTEQQLPQQLPLQPHTLQFQQQLLQQDVSQQSQRPAQTGHGLELRDVQATKASDQGLQILTLQGVIVNLSDAPRSVPPLEATVRDMQGAELDRWTFTAELPELPPGGSTGFRTEAIYPTTGSTKIDVTFIAAATP